ncbi:MAG: sulfurtransferase TusA family protein [Candidatus Omnitrophica bacterium]|nr:sulfurtransferase TusA family protein [Candidatus Omnitrophota bacterium]
MTPSRLRVDQSLDVRGLESPAAYQKAVDELKRMDDNGVLELYIDEGEALRAIPFGLRAEGHELVVSEPAQNGIRLLVRKRAPLP